MDKKFEIDERVMKSMLKKKPTKRRQSRNTIPHRPSIAWGKTWGGRGFSFIEVMVVIVIIGILAGGVAFKVKDYVDKSKTNRAKSDIATITHALEAYYGDKGQYPENSAGLEGLGLTNTKDPWGREYIYLHPGRQDEIEVLSYGRDGIEGGEGADADVNSWELGDS